MPTNESSAEESRVFLRSPAEPDFEAYAGLLKASEDFHKPWTPTLPAGVDPYGRASFMEWLRTNGMVHRRERLLVCRRSDDRILGLANLSQIVRGSFQSCFLGYWVGAEFANQGYMKEALPQITEAAFGRLKLHRIEANIRPENEASIRLVRGAGFQLEGYSPRYLKIAGEWCDHERWAILAD
jgi:ribosomal-protein-alanine N-acetyltransferase